MAAVKGRKVRKSVLPEVRGLTLDAAVRHLDGAGFSPIRHHFVDDYGAEDVILNQAPTPGVFIPVSDEITLFVNRTSWLRYLPSVFQQPAADGSRFLEGYLWIVQSVQAALERKLDHVTEYFEPYEAPAEFLPWLASWLALALDSGWDDRKRRRVLRDASRLYRVRGSRRALVEWIKLFTDLDVEVRENAWPMSDFRIGETSRIGAEAAIIRVPNASHCFVVDLPIPQREMSEEALTRINRIIGLEKPAHTVYCLQFEEPPRLEAEGVVLTVAVDRIGCAERNDQGPSEPAAEQS